MPDARADYAGTGVSYYIFFALKRAPGGGGPPPAAGGGALFRLFAGKRGNEEETRGAFGRSKAA